MQILSHPPLSAAGIELSQTNFPSAVFLINALDLTNSAGSTTFTDELGGLTFAASSISAGDAGGKTVLAADTAVTGTLLPPGTTDFIAFRLGEWGAGVGEIGNTSATGGIGLGLNGVLHDGTNTSTTTTGFSAGTSLRIRAIAVDWSADLMTPYELIDTVGSVTVKTATDLSGLDVNNGSGGIAAIAQSWSEPAQFSDLYCMGLLYFQNGLPSENSIKAALTWMYHRAVDDGVVELPPWWKLSA